MDLLKWGAELVLRVCDIVRSTLKKDEVSVVAEKTGAMVTFVMTTGSGERYPFEVPTSLTRLQKSRGGTQQLRINP
jgi:hypothetical protein